MTLTTLIIIGVVSGDMWDSRLYIVYGDQMLKAKFEHKQSWTDEVMQLRCIFLFSTIVERTTFVHTKSDFIDNLENHAGFPQELQLVRSMSEDVSAWSFQTSIFSGPMDENQQPTTQHDDLFESLSPECVKPSNAVTTRTSGQSEFSLKAIPHSRLSFAQGLSRHELVKRLRSLKVFPSPLAVYGPSPDALKDAASLGHEICTWTGSITYGNIRIPINDHARTQVHKHGITTASLKDAPYTMKLALTNAVYYATLVYFFRSIHNTSPIILQHYVEVAIGFLEAHHEIKARFYPLRTFGGMVWPAFIVACEAIDQGLRSRAIQCLRQIVTAGLRNGYAAELVVRELWQRKDAGEFDISWPDIIRTNNVCMVLT
ncbi:hypothetical protein BKA60DRAFT_547713 [Fusarium oxysporum]|nr:hypothetical protein BKA60DRAFT_547713 [Fusarium oxysporum]